MMQRCYIETVPNYASYGGRGIRVCERWHQFENFYKDMGDRPEGMSLDRIDNNGDYEPSNCRWTTFKTQHANRRNNRNLTLNGHTKCIAEWANELNLHPATIRNRLRRGASDEEALQPTQPTRRLMKPLNGKPK